MTGKISEDADRVISGAEKFAAELGGVNFGISAASIATYLATVTLTFTNKTLDSPNLTGTPTAPTPASTDNSTTIATTAYVKSVIPSGTGTGNVVGPAGAGNDHLALYADATGKLLKDGGLVTAFALGLFNDTDAAMARATLGVIIEVAIAPGTDLNTVVASGAYYCADTTCTNGPTVGGQWYLQVYALAGSSAYVMQIATGLTDAVGLHYVRTRVAGAWQAWQRLTTLTHSSGYLSKVGANIALLPKYGNLLTIGGVNAVIPDAPGVALAPTGLTPGTLYYIYAVQTAGVVTSLEASATVPVMSTAAGSQGLMVKTGDVTRRLVGMVRPIAGPAFSDLPAQRFVRSWLNRSVVPLKGNPFSGTTTSTSGFGVEISATARIEFLIWAEEAAAIGVAGTVYNGTAAQSCYSRIAFDGAAESPAAGANSSGINFDYTHATTLTKIGLTEGYHYATVFGVVSGGTGTWYSASGIAMQGAIG